MFKQSNPKSNLTAKESDMTDESKSTFDPYSEVENANKYIENIIDIGYKTPAIDDLISFPRKNF